ncbi:alpha-L-rhamnosidase C-terminal domain-containing protein [Massilioclostridium coli]|uniref:alpha-L-rhamnosidase-related protein n=1 Tax=Massilioclostridium coli TaxID=1870991 RepID=UPI00085C1A22|nr:alpha-L-rhamnosidase C-terminal domain-containing protein [Massilioclostridium coli]
MKKNKRFRQLLSGLLAAAVVTTSLMVIPAQADQLQTPTNWGDAHWIWSSEDLDENGLASAQDVWMDFRRDFTLDSIPEQAELNIAVDSKYWLYVNGKEVVWEGGVKRGPNPDDTYYDTVDITDYLVTGKNTIAIETWYWGHDSGHILDSGSGGLLVSSNLTDANTGKLVETGDGQWWSMKNPANLHDAQATANYIPESSTIYDGALAIDWTASDYIPSEENGWNRATIVGEDKNDPGYAGDGPWNDLIERPIPQWKDYGRTELELTPVDGFAAQTNVKPISDLGVQSDTYSIQSDLQLTTYNTPYGKAANATFVFGAKSDLDYYEATIDCLDYLNGGDTANLSISHSGVPVQTVDISDVITPENYKELIQLKLDVANEEQATLSLNGTTVATIDANLASNQMSFGYQGYLVLGYARSCVTVKQLTISDTTGIVYQTDFSEESDAEFFPAAKINNGLEITTMVFYSYYSYDGQKYEARLPYNAQMVPYIILDEGTEAGKQIKIYSDTYDQSKERITYITKAGTQEYEAKNWINGDYLYIELPDGVTIKEFGFRETGYNVPSGETTDFVGYFDSSVEENDPSVTEFTGGHTWTENQVCTENNFYDELWKKAARTLYVTIRDTYMDCPDRERGQYIGDAINEIEEAFYSLGPSVNSLSEKAIRNICDFQFEHEYNGRTYYVMSNVRPGVHEQEIDIQSLGTAHAAWTYYQYTGDQDVLVDCYQALYNYLTNYDMESQGNYIGTVKPRDPNTMIYNRLTGWSDWGDNQDSRIATTMWWYISASSVRKMADLEGVPATEEQKLWMDERLVSIEQNFEKFWNEELQAYATNWNTTDWYNPKELENSTHLVDERVNALAIVFGLVPENRYNAIRNLFMGTETTPAYENASIYMEKYVIQALYLMGYDTDAMNRMEKRMIEMVNVSTDSTLWEKWDRAGGTKNHGWSGGSMIAMSRYAAGVEPTGAGYSTWHVVPQMGNFESINTRVPSEIGNIDVTIHKTANGLNMTVVSPGNNAEIWVPIELGQQVVASRGEYKGIQQVHQKNYAVFEVSGAGTYSFTASQTNKDILDAVITYAENAKASGEYDNAIESVQKSFDKALEEAKTVAADHNASQETINQAWKTLLNEIHKLGFVAGDKTTLASLIEAANGINAELDRYVETGKAEFTAALEAAQAVYEDGDAMQAEVNEAADNLLKAMLNLRYKADKSILEEVLAEANNIDANIYTEESYAVLQTAIAEANEVMANENASQEEVDIAVANLQTAIEGLTSIEEIEDKTSSADNNGIQMGQESTMPKADAAKTGDCVPIFGIVVLTIAGATTLLLCKKR